MNLDSVAHLESHGVKKQSQWEEPQEIMAANKNVHRMCIISCISDVAAP